MSLGYALALGFCAAFGTLAPPLFPLFDGRVAETEANIAGILGSASGLTTLAGVAVCLIGIAICGMAGMAKEKELSADQKKETIREFNFAKGLWVAIFAGVMSACMALGIDAGKPIAALAAQRGTPDIWKNTPVFIVVFAGGFTVNFFWCAALNIRNRSAGDYVRSVDVPLLFNYLLSAAAGVTWYFQFMFYGMGTTRMGKYDFSSWSIHMAFIIVFSNLWGMYFHEWRGVRRQTMGLVWTGIAVLVLSVGIIGLGSYLVLLQD
jgi:L-rhamnose-H+ transport protein